MRGRQGSGVGRANMVSGDPGKRGNLDMSWNFMGPQRIPDFLVIYYF